VLPNLLVEEEVQVVNQNQLAESNPLSYLLSSTAPTRLHQSNWGNCEENAIDDHLQGEKENSETVCYGMVRLTKL
jgi:hypothetical protein